MKSSKSTVNPQLLIEQIRNEIEERKGDLAAEARAKAASSAEKANSPPLNAAMVSLGRARSKLQAARKWPVFLRFIRCNYHAMGSALVEAVKKIAEETGRIKKSLAALISRHDSLAKKHGLLIAEHEEKYRILERKFTYLEGAFHLVEHQYTGACKLLLKQLEILVTPTGLTSQTVKDRISGELDAHRFDAFCLAFEDQFRNSRDLLKERSRQYFPILKALKLRIPDAVGVDLGCGRGEWLETLKEQGIAARGVDLNPMMVARCRALGLNAEEGGCVAFLRSLPEHSVALVSGFHIVEHLAPGQLLDLFREAHRVLQPDGIAIFETPSPEVSRVASSTFYFDPHHLNPLTPEVLSFIGTHTGFSKVEVERFQPLVENGEKKGYTGYACVCTK